MNGDALNYMITEEQLDKFRQDGTLLRVIRDMDPANDVKGIVVAWDDAQVLIRKANRKMLKLDRTYVFQPFTAERPKEWTLPE
jgi:hypothetical protein